VRTASDGELAMDRRWGFSGMIGAPIISGILEAASSQHLVDLARCALPSAPCVIEMVFEDGGSFAVSLLGYEDDVVCLHAPRRAVRDQMRLFTRISDEQGGGYEVELEIVESFFHTGEEALVHATVTAVRRRKGRRLAPRVTVAERATARVASSTSLPIGAELDVRVIDVSATGIALSTQQPLSPGDLLTVAVLLANREMAIDARVVRCDRAPYDRFRIGCEIRNLAEHDQQALARLATPTEGRTPVDRRSHPGLPTAGQSGLNDRIRQGTRAA
jgi:PilZ domain